MDRSMTLDEVCAAVESLCGDGGASEDFERELLTSIRELAKGPAPVEPHRIEGPSPIIDLPGYVMVETAPVFNKLQAAIDAGEGGMILAHVFRRQMRVFFIPQRIAHEMQRLLSTSVGKASKSLTQGAAA